MKFLLILSFTMVSYLAYGQQRSNGAPISIGDVAKIELIFSSIGNEKYEVTQGDNGLWSCWQTIYSQYDNSLYAQRDDKPRLIKTVPAKMLMELLEYFNRPDSSRNIAWFGLRHDELVREMDSLKNSFFTADQRKTFIKGLANQDSLTSSMNRLLKNEFKFVEGTYYKIDLILKNGGKVSAQGTSGANLNVLPWKIEGYSVYDPRLSRLFNTLIGKEKESENIRRFAQNRIVFDMFLMSYKTGFHWSNFVKGFPESVALAGPYVRPWRFTRDGNYYHGHFTSVQLPENWIIGIHFDQPDSAMLRLKQIEQMLAGHYKNNKSVFDPLSVTPGGIVLFRLVGGNYNGIYGDDKDKLKSLSARYKEVQHANRDDLIYINIVPRNLLNMSRYLLLPDGKLIPVQQD